MIKNKTTKIERIEKSKIQNKKYMNLIEEVSYKNKSEVMTSNQFVRAILRSCRDSLLELRP